MTTKPLYVSIAVALEALQRSRERFREAPWETSWVEYLERCAEALPMSKGYHSPPKINHATIRQDRVEITGIYQETNGDGSYHASYGYRVQVTPSMARGFELKVVCRNGRLRSLLQEEFAVALAREYPPSEFHQRKERRTDVVATQLEEAVSRELH